MSCFISYSIHIVYLVFFLQVCDIVIAFTLLPPKCALDWSGMLLLEERGLVRRMVAVSARVLF